MKDYLTMKEAGLLLGKTTKTIKNYIKRGTIKNFFLVDGKYGQEYKISVRDLEPLGITCLDVLRDDFLPEGKKTAEAGLLQGNSKNIPGNSPETQGEPGKDGRSDGSFISRYEELVLELGRTRDKMISLAEENAQLKQDLEEKNMLIQVLMKKKEQG